MSVFVCCRWRGAQAAAGFHEIHRWLSMCSCALIILLSSILLHKKRIFFLLHSQHHEPLHCFNISYKIKLQYSDRAKITTVLTHLWIQHLPIHQICLRSIIYAVMWLWLSLYMTAIVCLLQLSLIWVSKDNGRSHAVQILRSFEANLLFGAT